VDDLLDYTADERRSASPIGGDLREGKVTLPIIYLLQRGGEAADRLIREDRRQRARGDARPVAGRAAAARRAPRSPIVPTLAPSNMPTAPSPASTSSRRLASVTRCSRCPTTSSPGTAEPADG
jgi:hypothetical protein